MFKKLIKKFKDRNNIDDFAALTVLDLEVGCIFEYDLRSFEVKEAYEYDWGDNCKSKEYKISDGTETLYLNVENDDELELFIFKKVKIRRVGEDLPELILNHKDKKPPTKIAYEGTKFYYDKESLGLFRSCKDDAKKDESWIEFVNWSYYDDDDTKILSIEQWGADEFTAAIGATIKEFHISSILPKPTK